MGSRRGPERFAAVFLWAMLAGGLGGCAGPRDPTALIPAPVQNTVMAEDKLREARAAAAAQKGEGTAVSVTDILARARAVQDQPAAAQASASASATASSGASAAIAQAGTNAPPPDAATPEAAAARRALMAQAQALAPAQTPSSPPIAARTASARQVSAFAAETTGTLPRGGTRAPLIDIVFEPGQEAPGAADAAALAKAVKAARLGPGRPVTVLAGPGSGADPFAQALLANKRARAVKALLPQDIPAAQLYDPDLEPDTVRIIAGSRE
ncbi:hypothetical protein [Xanthobacter sp. VNH20]|uniref:hypothetical protein n=1 Tax=Xanthobacter sp. VNH20 TaxID=3156616 RepID=UPI0032B62816